MLQAADINSLIISSYLNPRAQTTTSPLPTVALKCGRLHLTSDSATASHPAGRGELVLGWI